MSFHWLCCRDSQGQFRYFWWPMTENLMDYWTKHHTASHHQNFRPKIITSDALRRLHKMRALLARVC